MARILPAISVGVVLSVAIFASTPTQAADLNVSVSRRVNVEKAAQKTLIVTQNGETPQRACGWLGPGGRAVYRCR
ncbi:MAG: hypothetical protein ACLPTZ_10145 [Beijerinckiaceae bacterium]